MPAEACQCVAGASMILARGKTCRGTYIGPDVMKSVARLPHPVRPVYRQSSNMTFCSHPRCQTSLFCLLRLNKDRKQNVLWCNDCRPAHTTRILWPYLSSKPGCVMSSESAAVSAGNGPPNEEAPRSTFKHCINKSGGSLLSSRVPNACNTNTWSLIPKAAASAWSPSSLTSVLRWRMPRTVRSSFSS